MNDETGVPPDRSMPDGYADQLGRGVMTFADRPMLTSVADLDRWRPDVAIVGAPLDLNASNKPGARFGPRALRADADHPGSYNLDLGLEIFDHLNVIDYGDAWCPHGNSEVGLNNIRQRVSEVAVRGIVPIVLGGDHSVTWPSVEAVAAAHGWGEIGVVHFDAHADTAEQLEGNLASHGTPMRRLIESGAVRGDRFVQVGLRGYWPPASVFEWMRSQGMRWHLMDEIVSRGAAAVIEDAVAEALSNGSRGLYLSVDIDVLDPGFAPGTGTPEPGGMNPADLLRAVRRLALETPIIGMDIVEVSPPFDHAQQTVNNAHRIVMECLSGLAAKAARNSA